MDATTYYPLAERYSTGNGDAVSINASTIVVLSRTASSMNINDLIGAGGFYLHLLMSAAEGTADLLTYLTLTY